MARTALGLFLIVAVFVVAFWPSIAWMAGEWSGSSGALSHGYLVAAISIALFIRAIPSVAAEDRSPSWGLLPILIALSAAWLLAYIATVVAVQTLVLPAILLVAIATAVGVRGARRLAFPILYLYFAMPAWEHLQFIFQAITVSAVTVLLRIADVPALVSGNSVHLSAGTFQIAGGCSGLSFIVAGLSLAVLYAHLYYRRAKRAMLLVAVTLAVSMFGNWVRVFTIILIGYRTNMESGLVDDHLTFGWIIFAILMVPVFFLARRLEDDNAAAIAAGPTSAPGAAATTSWVAVVVAIGAMLVGPVWAGTVAAPESQGRAFELALPDGRGEWTGPGISGWDWQPRFAGPAAERVVQYGPDDRFVLVYANLYLSQAQDRELVYFSNRIAGSWPDRNMPGFGDETVSVGDGVRYRQSLADNYAGTWLIWYRYQVGTRFETSDVRAKYRQAVETLQGRPESGVVAFAALCDSTCERAQAILTSFANQLGNDVRVDFPREAQ